ncbi:MAG: type II secretion system F family protein [Deltaproteobacteria bacterium]|nr:type II secretion system F family protein [Deltaproteobacteria bacterium]MBI4197402.1 type II secretion system F family protein [Deltaproteobacteria bacterium]
MGLFYYRARDLHGSLITGHLEVLKESDLLARLTDQGLIPVLIREVSSRFRFPSFSLKFQRKIRSEELIVFTRQFQTLFKAGLGMDAILTALIKQCRNKSFREVLLKIRADIAGGSTLAKAFSKHSSLFRDLYVNMLGAGEEAGILDKSLEHLGLLLEKEREIHASVKSATLYPKIVIGVLILATTVLMIFVVPKFATFYSSMDVSLPWPTLFLMGASSFFVHYWFLLAAVIFGGYSLFHWYQKTARGRLRLGEIAFKLPVFGPLALRVANARFCHIFSALYRSGLPVIRALEIVEGTIENGAFGRDIQRLRTELTRGRSLAEAMSLCSYFTPVVMEAVAAGEKSGALDEMMESIGHHYDTEVGHTVKNLSTLLEPLLLIIVFGMVGLFALAIFLPIWNMTQIVK